MHLKKIYVLIAVLGLLQIMRLPEIGAAQELGLSEENYLIYSVKAERLINVDTIVEKHENHDVILFGEEHNDSVTHYLELLLLKKLYAKYGASLALSLEMFDRDVQIVLNEYLTNTITEKHFIKDVRVWSNYKDYRALVEFAKEMHLDVIAANAPSRYTNMASTKGQESLMSLSKTAKSFIAPLPYDTATGAHYEKLMQVMRDVKMPMIKKDTLKKPKMPITAMPSFNINQGQSLWNATMAYSIYEYLSKNPDNKVLHVHGKFHSDEYFGVPQHLEKYDNTIKCLVITTLPDELFPDIDFEKYKNRADYIIITDPSIPKTYNQ